MDYVLGIDGGGTATRAAILDLNGRLCGAGRGGPSNYDDVGEGGAQANIEEAVEIARREADLKEGPFAAAFLGLAGVVSEKDRTVIRRIARKLNLADPERVGVSHDCRVALAGGLSGRPGIVLITGTGSSCYGRNAAGASWRAGGWGNLLGDEGSGYWLGVEAMKAAVRAHDGRGPDTVLKRRLLRWLGLSNMNELMPRLYVEGLPRSEIAALAPMVFKTARERDAVARALIEEGAEQLAECVVAVAERLGLSVDPSELVLVGGLRQAGTIFTRPLEAAIEERLPRCRMVPPELPPTLGAALLALRASGVNIGSGVDRVLRRSAKKMRET